MQHPGQVLLHSVACACISFNSMTTTLEAQALLVSECCAVPCPTFHSMSGVVDAGSTSCNLR